MKRARKAQRVAGTLLIAAAVVCCTPASATAQIGPNCTVSVLNRSVTQNADGSWVLPNVPANFGPVRARVTCLINGETISGESDPFVVPANGVVNLPPLRFGQTTPIPTALTVSGPAGGLTAPGQTAQLVVTAVYRDGTTRNVTVASNVTTYTVSNPAIATVSGDGVVRAVQSGTVIIQAMHEGASGMTSVRVALGGGADSDSDGIPDADEVALGLNPNNAIDALEDFDRDNLTNLQEYQRGTNLRVADTDGDGLRDGDEVTRGTNPLVRDTDGDGIGDGLEVQTGSDPLNPTSFNLSAALSSVAVTPPQFTLTFNTIAGESSVQLRVNGALRDGTTLDLTSAARGTSYSSSNLSICSFSGTPGRVFAGQSGGCVITVTVAGFTATVNGTVNTFAPTALSSVALGGPGNGIDVAGPVVYVAAGGAGLKVVDVSNRAAPFVAATLPLPGTANDVKLAGTRAYVAAGSAGLHVVDVTTPVAPQLLGTVDTPGSATDVRVRGTLAFVADGSGGLQVVDVSNAVTPRVVGSLATVGPANGVDLSETLAVVAVGGAGVQVVNIANPALPVTAGLVDTPGVAQDIVLDATGGFAYVADYTGSLRAIDVRNPAAPRLAGATTGALGGYLNDVARTDTFVFGADVFFSVSGVPIVDVSDPDNLRPRAILNFPGGSAGLGIAVDGSHVYLGTTNGGLYVGQFRIQQDLNGIPPTVSITSPAQGDTFVQGEAIMVSVSASDDLAVSEVALQMNGVTVARDTTAPYQFDVAAPITPATLALGATAVDLGNNTGTASTITITVIPDPLTTVVGRVVRQDGTPVAGASVACGTQSGASGTDGSFSLPGVRTAQPTVACSATVVTGGIISRGISLPTPHVRGGTTAVGDLVLAPVPIIASITPRVVEADRSVTLAVSGSNLTNSAFAFVPLLQPPAFTIGSVTINGTGTGATIPITTPATTRGRFTLIGTNSVGGADTTPTDGNTLTVVNAQDDVDSDGDGFPDGLELLFGSDPGLASSTPNWRSRGEVTSLFVSVRNTLFPSTFVTAREVQSPVFAVVNRLFPTTFVTTREIQSPAFSVVNRLFPSTLVTTREALSPTVAVLNRTFPSGFTTLRDVQSLTFSLLNSQAVGATVPLHALTMDAGLEPLTLTVDVPTASDQLIEGQTVVVRARMPGADLERVEFRVEGAPLETILAPPYEWLFTVPSGVNRLTFEARGIVAGGNPVAAAPLVLGVVASAPVALTGRVVDADGQAVAGAVVDVVSEGLDAEYFEFAGAREVPPDLAGLTPDRRTRVTAANIRNPDLVFGSDPHGTRLVPDYAGRLTGQLIVQNAGLHRFVLGAREGARLTVGGATVIDVPASTSRDYLERSSEIDLRAGTTPIQVTFYQGVAAGDVQLRFVPPYESVPRTVPPALLVPSGGALSTVTDQAGRFAIPAVPAGLASIQLRATDSRTGRSGVSRVWVPPPRADADIGDVAITNR